MELEIRARISDKKAFQHALQTLTGIRVVSKGVRQVDTYLRHVADVDRLLVFRIRRRDDDSVFTLKTKSMGGKDILWQDIDIPLAEPNRLEDILLNSGYVYVCLIDKIRDSFRYGDVEINIDNIRELGLFVELEVILDDASSWKTRHKELVQLLHRLGIEKDHIVERGYVPLMIERVEAEPSLLQRKTPS